jgi:hypothetical protein
MHRFLARDRRDPGGFEQLIGDVLERATAARRPAVVYGEVVALLWEAGLVSAVIELESLWNELGRSYSFSLICGYPVQHGAAEALGAVCRLHSSVIGAPNAGPRAVRGFVAERPGRGRRARPGPGEHGGGPVGSPAAGGRGKLVWAELAARASGGPGG